MLEDKKAQLDKIAEQVKICEKCGLYKEATQAVPGSGNPEAELVFIGEAPGFHEDQQGLPFVGRSGKLLDFMLGQIGYKREDVWIGNIIKHRPPNNRDPLPEEINTCKPYLTEQINIINPKLIVTLGRFSMNYFLPSAKISDARGKVAKLGDKNIYPVYHPAAGLRNPKMKTALIEDFLNIPQVIKGLDNPDIIETDNNLNNSKESESDKKNPESQIGLFI